MLNKLKKIFGFDEWELTEQTSSTNNLIEIRALQSKIRALEEIIGQKNKVLQELSKENMELGRDRQRLADMVASQSRLIDVYENQAG
ncbi:Mg2+ and Co2+ transporter CorA [Streptococcus rupicaprae]|uniref:Mg2+ and Co2+ transporter CorA n=1 Tax=Streptococcus rupicaprae TaxID=759619 RepID=A0ABV2FJF1_9STRE